MPEQSAGGSAAGPEALTATEAATPPPVEMPGPAPMLPTPKREAQSAVPETAGDTLAVPGFEILGVLGEGGMGVVYKARQHGLNRLVALKTIHRRFAADTQLRARFRREAEAVARLKHPHTVEVHAWGEHDGVPYFVLEFCGGGNLHARVKGQPQAPVEAARLVEKLARAVQAAHEADIIHRDLKPANILLQPAGDEPALNTPWGIPKVADFGLCRTLGEDVWRTTEGALAGSPTYMAPEQAEGRARDIGPATDVWALGAILYELLTGRPPFGGRNLPKILHAVCSEEPPRPRALLPGVPEKLEAICLRCLRKQAAERYPTAQALAGDLRRFLSDERAAVSDPPVPAVAGPVAPRPRSVFVVAALVGLLLAGAAGYYFWPRNAPRPAGTEPGQGAGPSAALPTHPAAQPEMYAGSIDVRIWRKTGDRTLRMRLTDEEALPLHDGDRFRIEAHVTPAAYLYLFGIDTEGEATPIYPWQPKKGWGSRPAQESVRNVLSLPEAADTTWGFTGGKEGMETFLLLARPTPLEADDETVRGWFQGFPPQRPVPNARSAVWFDNGRMVEDDPRRTRAHYEERPVDDPLLRLRGLMGRLQPHAAFTTAVSFAKRGQ